MAARTNGPRATGWVLGTVVTALLISAGGWLVGVSPVLDEAAVAQEQADAVAGSNEVLQVKIDRLRNQFENLDSFKAELSSLRTQIPSEAQLSEYYRTLDQLASERGVTITDVSGETPFSMLPPAPPPAPAPVEAPDAEVTVDGAQTAPDESATAPDAPVTYDGFVAIPLTITVLGPYENVVGFLESLQTGSSRLFLVTAFSGTAQDDAEATGGRPATVVGDLEVSVTGYTYVLLEPTDRASAPEVVEPAPLPGPVPGRNPLVPVVEAPVG